MPLIPPSQRAIVPPLPEALSTLISGTGDAPPGMVATIEELGAYERAGLGSPQLATMPEVRVMGLPALIPAAGALAAIPAALAAVAPAVAGVAGVGGLLFGIAQALGLGEGEGLFGLDILGGGGEPAGGYRNGIPFGGPGLKEPPAEWVLKEWHVSYDWGRLQYYLVQMPTGGRKIAMYNTRTKKWKVWRWRSPILAVIGKNMPSHKQLTRLKRNLARHGADARTILKITNPTGYAKQLGYKKYKKR